MFPLTYLDNFNALNGSKNKTQRLAEFFLYHGWINAKAQIIVKKAF